MTVTNIATHTHPNAVCAIHLLRGSIVVASAEILRPNLRYFVCAGHAAMARNWEFMEVWAKKGRLLTSAEIAEFDAPSGQEP